MVRIADMDRNTAQQAAQAFQVNYYAQKRRADDAEAKIARLQAIVDKLPRTADGVPVVPGIDNVWVWRKERAVAESTITIDPMRGWRVRNEAIVFGYSTPEAAEAAERREG
jgi:hypothetical protein